MSTLDPHGMKVHEGRTDPGMQILRVPGGWLYMFWDWNSDMWLTPVFVPYNNEFEGKSDERDRSTT